MSSNTGSKSSKGSDKSSGFSDFEKQAMKQRAAELKAEAKAGAKKADLEKATLEKIAEMPEHDRKIAERIYTIMKETAPMVDVKLWYGMPAFARDGKVICFFQSGSVYKTRYSTFGFSDESKLDEGNIWPISFAIKELTPEVETRIIALVKKALSI